MAATGLITTGVGSTCDGTVSVGLGFFAAASISAAAAVAATTGGSISACFEVDVLNSVSDDLFSIFGGLVSVAMFSLVSSSSFRLLLPLLCCCCSSDVDEHDEDLELLVDADDIVDDDEDNDDVLSSFWFRISEMLGFVDAN